MIVLLLCIDGLLISCRPYTTQKFDEDCQSHMVWYGNVLFDIIE